MRGNHRNFVGFSIAEKQKCSMEKYEPRSSLNLHQIEIQIPIELYTSQIKFKILRNYN